jgi:hypothetical protein
MVGALALDCTVIRAICSSRLSISPRLTSTWPATGRGSKAVEQLRSAGPNKSETGQGCPKVISVAWMRFFSAVR